MTDQGSHVVILSHRCHQLEAVKCFLSTSLPQHVGPLHREVMSCRAHLGQKLCYRPVFNVETLLHPPPDPFNLNPPAPNKVWRCHAVPTTSPNDVADIKKIHCHGCCPQQHISLCQLLMFRMSINNPKTTGPASLSHHFHYIDQVLPECICHQLSAGQSVLAGVTMSIWKRQAILDELHELSKPKCCC